EQLPRGGAGEVDAAAVVHHGTHEYPVRAPKVASQRRHMVERAGLGVYHSAPHPPTEAAQSARAVRRQQQRVPAVSGELRIAGEIQHLSERTHPVEIAEAASVHELHPRLRADNFTDMLSHKPRTGRLAPGS